MPILLVLLLVASVLDIHWPAAVVLLPPGWSAGLTAGLVGLSVLASLAVSLRTARVLHRHPERRARAARWYARWRQFAFYLNVGITVVALFVLGWGRWVRTVCVDRPSAEVLAAVVAGELDPSALAGHTFRLLPFAELLVPAPYLLTMMLNWLAYWPAERAIFRAAHPDRPFWSPFGFWLNNARQFLFIAFLPVLLCVAHQTATRAFPVFTSHWAYQFGMSFSALGLAMLLPLVIRPLLGLKRLPPGPLRDRLHATARRLGVGFSDYLLWPTRGAVANAMVIGIIPWARYVIFTDRLLEDLADDELDAVFGHEAGHARYGHLPYYMVFLALSGGAIYGLAMLLFAGLDRLGVNLDPPPSLVPFLPLPPLAIMGMYLFVVFGWLSRVCERQADIFGARAGSCGNPDCTGHDADTMLVTRGRGLCPTGVRSMVRALEKVLMLNGWDAAPRRGNLFQRAMGWVRAWQHGPTTSRIDYLLGLIDQPERADRHDRRAFWVRVLLAIVLMAFTAVASDELARWLF
ncbi:MAG: M48 family metallopeptidase [Fimbriiglobus sp.]|jgi:Zn-dependent protease with chaperone function|nr:M48 family metallopeptidase [Fimbriiglobus sp.]